MSFAARIFNIDESDLMAWLPLYIILVQEEDEGIVFQTTVFESTQEYKSKYFS